MFITFDTVDLERSTRAHFKGLLIPFRNIYLKLEKYENFRFHLKNRKFHSVTFDLVFSVLLAPEFFETRLL